MGGWAGCGTRVGACMYACMHVRVCVCVRVCLYVCVCLCFRTCPHTPTHAHTNIHVQPRWSAIRADGTVFLTRERVLFLYVRWHDMQVLNVFPCYGTVAVAQLLVAW